MLREFIHTAFLLVRARELALLRDYVQTALRIIVQPGAPLRDRLSFIATARSKKE